MTPIDHLMWVVPDLGAGVDELERLAGARATLGGSHPSMGTANAILGLGAGAYLEVLGPDPDLAEPIGFGATLAAERAPRLASWAVRTTDIDAVCASLTDAGWPVKATPMTRTRPDGSTLTWSLAVLPGRPLGDHWPFVIDWGSSPHPSDSAPGQCTLERLVVTDSDPRELQRLLGVLHVQDVSVEPGDGVVRATLGSPLGPVEL